MTQSARRRGSALIGRVLAVLAIMMLMVSPLPARAAGGNVPPSSREYQELWGYAHDTWQYYNAGVDPNTNLPLDNLGFYPAPARGTYTSSANIGVYFWAVVAAYDLGIIKRQEAASRIKATLTELSHIRSYNGFTGQIVNGPGLLFQWYSTTNGHSVKYAGAPNQTDCSTEPTPTFDDCYQLSNVDNGWLASGLIVAREALPEVKHLADQQLAAMDFGIFYDSRPETQCNTNPAVTGNQPTGQMFGTYFPGLPPDQGTNWQHYYHNGALYSDPRISAYIGMGLHEMPGNVWWKSWRELPPPYCPTDPDFSWQGQPQKPGVNGYWQDWSDPQSHQVFHVWEGHYTYPGTTLTFIPTYAAGMFEGLMAEDVVPETSWGPSSFGLADLRWTQVQMTYATQMLHYKVWGLSPSSTPDDTGGYAAYGTLGILFPPGQQLAQCGTGRPGSCDYVTETTVTPHASFLALNTMPVQAIQNIRNLRAWYPDVYGPYGFYDALNPTTGSVGHRYLVLDQSMIMAAIDDYLTGGIQRYFSQDPVSWAARTYLGYETMNIH